MNFPAPLRQHVTARQLAEPEHRGEIDLDDFRPVLLRELGRGRAPDDPRIINENVDRDAATYELPFGTFLAVRGGSQKTVSVEIV
jgi:hypothetical protein